MHAATRGREPKLKAYAALIFTVVIALVGAFVMSLTSSPTLKGAALLWIPAALQLIAGVWLGPRLGLIAGGLGAYAAGIISYGGWGIVDIIQNPIAGGVANSFLPAVLFRVLHVNPDLGSESAAVMKAIPRIVTIFVLLVVVGLGAVYVNFVPLGVWSPLVYLPSFAIVALAPLLLRDLRIDRRQFLTAVLIVILSCAASAAIGVVGAIVGGQSLQGALVSVGVGWFLGDTVSALFGLYVLAAFTDAARERGVADDNDASS